MPTSFKRFAIDHDGDGRRDVVDPCRPHRLDREQPEDGWVAGQTWGYEVVLPKGFNFCSPIARA
jgi:membrane-bound lytic murein transglycosylase B